MKKQHWRRRSLFPDSAVTQRKVTVLQPGARYRNAARIAHGHNVVNVSHRQLLSEGVLTQDQLSLLQRLLERSVIDALCASQLVKTYQKLGLCLDRYAMRLFLELGSRLSDDSNLVSTAQRLTYINRRVGFCYNLAHPRTLSLCVYSALNQWISDQTDQSVLTDLLEMEQLSGQLKVQKEYWSKLANQSISAVFVDQQLELIERQQNELAVRLESLGEQTLKVSEEHQKLMQAWDPSLDILAELAQYPPGSAEFATRWKSWCQNASELAPELAPLCSNLTALYADGESPARVWQWLKELKAVNGVDQYRFEPHLDECGHACQYLNQI